MTRVHLIGDPHLGKKFEEGVPLHRRGERETGQSVQFCFELEADADYIVMVGDLFDNPYVNDAVIVSTARAVLGAAERNPDTTYIMMAGNHDKPRNLSMVGAWHAFKEMTQDRLVNLHILDRPAVVGPVALFPWEWDRRADEQVADLADSSGVTHAVGHWDLAVFDGKDDHLAPVDALRQAFGNEVQIFSGHYHVKGWYLNNAVWCTGSMLPYSHAEDPESAIYVTLTREEALTRTDLRDKHVRLLLAPGEDEPELDCLALTHKRLQAEADDQVTVSIDDFDFHKIVRTRIAGRDPVVVAFIEERMSLAPEEQRGSSDQAL